MGWLIREKGRERKRERERGAAEKNSEMRCKLFRVKEFEWWR
jgi:hypothetical protein